MKCVVSRATGKQIDHPLLKNERNTLPGCSHPRYKYDAEINTLDELCDILRIDPDGIIMCIDEDDEDICYITIYDDYIE